ncbi:hypothetical protein OEV98_14200 [Caldibacillus lycopersici]|uniref:YneQ n=1 Tax=Perspicuibacillus lycopersici TaxID=1325689 RepID=A0AAE3IWI6_9BACI|nr:hypothetical protein [Perspicuibacillus lycopersici]MCU9614691.1 hypothetical protein [Perspicuibacillus lycopersici]
MAFGIRRNQLEKWKQKIDQGEIAFLTHYWYDARFPDAKTVTKVGCNDIPKLIQWGKQYGLKEEWMHHRKDGYSHFDLIGDIEKRILIEEGKFYTNRILVKEDRN